MIHGLPNAVPAERVGHPQVDWTNGCIAVTDEELDEIWTDVEDGTTIIIFP
jgi:murein L,D-transpeptidase YafK